MEVREVVRVQELLYIPKITEEVAGLEVSDTVENSNDGEDLDKSGTSNEGEDLNKSGNLSDEENLLIETEQDNDIDNVTINTNVIDQKEIGVNLIVESTDISNTVNSRERTDEVSGVIGDEYGEHYDDDNVTDNEMTESGLGHGSRPKRSTVKEVNYKLARTYQKK